MVDWNRLLYLAVGLNCILAALRLRGVATPSRGWFVVFSLLGLGAVVSWFALPDSGGYWLGGVWAIVVAIPALALAGAMRLSAHAKFGAAAALARLARLLHPVDGWQDAPAVVELYRCLHEGQLEQAERLIARLRAQPSPFAAMVLVTSVGLTDDWAGLCEWVESHPDRRKTLRDATTLIAYLAALGRTGRHAEMFGVYRELAKPWLILKPSIVGALYRLSLVCQTGRVATAKMLLDGPLSLLPQASRWFRWAEAEQIAGNTEAATELLNRVIADPKAGANLEQRAERRLRSPLAPLPPDALDADAVAVLDKIDAEVAHAGKFAVSRASSQQLPLATYVLAAVTALIHVLGIKGGEMRVPINGEWWRVITAAFQHFNATHLILNVGALLLFGTWLERAWARSTFVLCYLLSIIIPFSLMAMFSSTPMRLVGASGAIMGLFGALVGRLLVGKMRGKSYVVLRQLILLVALFAVQVMFDAVTPQVSAECHALGFLTGLVFGFVVTLRQPDTA